MSATYTKANFAKHLIKGGIDWAIWHKDRMLGQEIPETMGEAMMLHKLADDGFGNLIAKNREAAFYAYQSQELYEGIA